AFQRTKIHPHHGEGPDTLARQWGLPTIWHIWQKRLTKHQPKPIRWVEFAELLPRVRPFALG
ncbi:MAG: hypothetical protein AAF191_07230, partial [Verrucomicrobiota bacterium]